MDIFSLNPNIRIAVYCAGASSEFLDQYIIKLNELSEPRFYLKVELDKALAGARCVKHPNPRKRINYI
jgi:hypothetical protein